MSDSPYPGLRPFERDETDIFFGRETHVDELITRLGQGHFVAVLGPSGCGKSSLVRTGLLADLESGFLAAAGAFWRIAELRPGAHPLASLAQALLAEGALHDLYLPQVTDPEQKRALLRAKLQRIALGMEGGLPSLLRESPLPADTNLLVVVDQFEEIFRYHSQSEEEAEAFVALLLAGVQAPLPHPVYVVITMRSDFLGDCARFRGLAEAINQGLFLTPRLKRTQLQDAICAPAKVFGGEVAPDLANHLLNATGDEADQLPVLQHALMRMWTLADAENPTQPRMEMAHYQAIGGLKDALSMHADEAYAELSAAQQSIAEILFRGLSERSSDLRDTRRPVKLAETVLLANTTSQAVIEVVDVFRQPGRGFITPATPLDPDSVLDIVHESLIRQWQRLRRWADEEAEAGEIYRRLEDAALRWEQGKTGLWRTPELEMALDWRTKVKPTAIWARRYGRHFPLALRFLTTSEAEQQAEQRRKTRRHWLVTLSALAVALVMTLLAGWGFYERDKAEQHRDQALQNAVALLESQLSTAVMLGEHEKYPEAQRMLDQTRDLDADMLSPAHRHTRNLLAWFNQVIAVRPAWQYNLDVPVTALAHSPAYWFLGDANGDLHVWNGEQVWKHYLSVNSAIRALAYDNRQLAMAEENGKIHLFAWETEPPMLTKTWTTDFPATALAIHGNQLAAGDKTGKIQRWDLATGQALPIENRHEEEISALAFSPDGQVLAGASYDNSVRIDTKPLFKHSSNVYALAFNANGRRLAGGDENTIQVWDTLSGARLKTLPGRHQRIRHLAFVPDIDQLLAADAAGVVLWDLEQAARLRFFTHHNSPVAGLGLNQARIFSVSTDGALYRWPRAVPHLHTLPVEGEPVTIRFASDGRSRVVGFKDGRLCVYTHTTTPACRTQDDIPRSMSLARNLLATVTYEGIKVWKISWEKGIIAPHTVLQAQWPEWEEMDRVALAADTALVGVNMEGKAFLFDLAKRQKQPLPAYQRGRLARDSQGIVNTHAQGVTRWTLAGGTLKKHPERPLQAEVSGQLFLSPGGDHLFSIDSHARLSGWDMKTHDRLFTLPLPQDGEFSNALLDGFWQADFYCPGAAACRLAIPVISARQILVYDLSGVYQ